MSSDASAKMDDCPTNFDDIVEQNLLLPPVNSVAKVMFSTVSVYYSAHRGVPSDH